MKVYVASPIVEIGKASMVMAQARTAGHEITFDWTGSDGKIRKDWREAREEGEFIAECERQGIINADVLILVLPGPRFRDRGLGCYIELGMALGLGKTVWVVGFAHYSRDTVFFCLPDIHFLTMTETEIALVYAKETEDATQAALEAGSLG